ncbi:MAG: class I SAM-dependent methyltransferase [Cyclobacteriaceae bacterium]
MATYTTEIASDQLVSDNPIHQRLLKAYYAAQPYIKGDLLEVGCGEGRGVSLLAPLSNSYLAIDKIGNIIDKLQNQYPGVNFIQMIIPPFGDLADALYDVVVSFQVIEHIKDDRLFLKELYRVLKPGGQAIISTPNIKKTLTRNPWHEREYTADALKSLAIKIFDQVDAMGIAGNQKVMDYYEENKKSVARITRFDIFDLQHRLPASLLKIPYDLMNRLNRNLLKKGNTQLVSDITHEDYLVSSDPEHSLDLFYLLKKA